MLSFEPIASSCVRWKIYRTLYQLFAKSPQRLYGPVGRVVDSGRENLGSTPSRRLRFSFQKLSIRQKNTSQHLRAVYTHSHTRAHTQSSDFLMESLCCTEVRHGAQYIENKTKAVQSKTFT